MKLRTQLILVFFFLAIVPLAGLTLYSYTSSTAALRQAAREEASELARGMGARLELVRHDMERRIRDLGANPFYSIMSEDPGAAGPDAYRELVAGLGDFAGMIESIRFEPTAPPQRPGFRAPPLPEGAPPAPPTQPVQPGDALVITMPGMPSEVGARAPETGTGGPPTRTVEVPTGDRFEMWAREGPWEGTDWAAETRDGGEGRERRREIHLKWLAERRAEGMMRAALAAREFAQEMAARVAAGTAEGEPDVPDIAVSQGRESRLTHLDLRSKVETPGDSEGQVVAQVNADRVLASILSPARRGRGEIPFAMDREGRIYTRTAEDLEILEGLRSRWEGFPSPDRTPDDWVAVVRTEEATGMAFGIARPLREGLQEIRRAALRNLGYGMGLVGLALLGILPLSRRMTRNLTVLTLGAERLAQGDLNARVPVRTSDEFGKLGESFNRMAAELKVHQRRLVEQERLRKELEISREIQREMLPRSPLRSPFAEVRGVSIPAREVGGDFFNYFTLPGGRIAILIGDVSGKGVPAALLMANIQATLRARLPVTDDLASLAEQLDREIDESTPAEAYLTLFLGILDGEAGLLRWLNAGHNTQFVLRADGRFEKMPSSGRPLGLLPGGRFEEGTLRLERGDAIFLYTDGLVEAQNAGDDEFGTQRLERILEEERGSNIDRVLSRIEEEVRRYRGDIESNDDVTMVLLKTAEELGG